MKNKKRKKNIIIGSLLAIVCVMAIGYAAFSTNLNINGSGSISSNWDIKITNMTSNPLGDAYNLAEPTWEGLTANFSVGLNSPGDYMIYEIEVTNSGNIDAVLNALDIDVGTNPIIMYEVDGLEVGDTLEARTAISFYLKIEFDPSVTSQPENVTSDVELKLDYGQDPNNSGGSSGGSGGGSLEPGESETLTKPTVTVDYKSITTTNTSTYPWVENDGVWTTTNQGVNSTTTNLSFDFTLTKTSTLTFDWSVSSESASYDYVYYTITKDGSTMSGTGTSTKIGGTSYGATEDTITYNNVSKELEVGTYTVTFTYRKDGSSAGGTDTAYVKNFAIDNANQWIVSIDYHYDCSIYRCTYIYNSGETVTVTENPTVVFYEEGILKSKVSDNYSNVGTTITYIDNTPPTLNGVSLTKVTGGYTITVNAIDTASGIAKYEFKKGEGVWINRRTKNTYTVTANDVTDINIMIRITDNAGNSKEVTYQPIQTNGTLGFVSSLSEVTPISVNGMFVPGSSTIGLGK